MHDGSAWPYPKWIAHRGAGRRAPENTMAAFALGANLGYAMFECDVQVSTDGVAFLLHDDTLDRTTNGTGLACQRTWAELRLLDAGSWHGPEGRGEPIASLDEVGRFCRRRGLLLNLEIKPPPGQEVRFGESIAKQIVRDWREEGGAGRWPLLSSFQPASLAAARDVAPQLPRALLLEALLKDSLDLAISLDCVAVILEASQWQPIHVRRIKALGMHCMTYTVNDKARADALFEMGVEGVITDALGST